MVANWLSQMFMTFFGTIFFLVLVIIVWLGMTLISMKFWAWLFNSGRAPKIFYRLRERFIVKDNLSGGAYGRFFHITFSFFAVFLIIFAVILIYSVVK